MNVVRAEQAKALSAAIPDERGLLRAEWLEGPFNSDRLDVGIVTLSEQGATPPHVHLGGQVIIVTAGRGFVETDDERHELAAGDIVIAPPGERHVHGALADSSFSHITVTTGGYRFPDDPS